MSLSPTCDPAVRPGDRVALRTERFDARLASEARVWTGVVAQVFDHAAVARADDGGAALTLLDPSRALVPYGLQIPWTRLQPRAGERVRLGGRRLYLVDRWNRGRWVVLLGAGVSLALEAQGALCRATLGRQLEELILPARTRTLLDGEPLPASAAARTEVALLGSGLSRLATAIARDDGPALQAAAAPLVGLGSGSTPSGDDLLVGCAATLRRLCAAGWAATALLDALHRALGGVTPEQTTEVSRAMLAQAREGAFAEPLLEVVRTLGTPGAPQARLAREVAALGALGQHSGADMLAGAIAVAHTLHIRDRGGAP